MQIFNTIFIFQAYLYIMHLRITHKKVLIGLFFFLVVIAPVMVEAQCSLCTKTAQQLGDGPAKGLNTAIIYLAFAPFIIVGFIGYRWWKSQRNNE